jgi:hypothetical protein
MVTSCNREADQANSEELDAGVVIFSTATLEAFFVTEVVDQLIVAHFGLKVVNQLIMTLLCGALRRRCMNRGLVNPLKWILPSSQKVFSKIKASICLKHI